MKYSVLMSVYYKENPIFLEESMKSILNQTLDCDEFVIVCDGPLTRPLDDVLEKYASNYKSIKLIRDFKSNMGLSEALRYGILKCKNNIIARMDSDDIADLNRCNKQMAKILEGYDLVGSNVDEFIDEVDNIVGERTVPCEQHQILNFSKRRNPFNHPSIMYRKSCVIEAGNYRNFVRLEDYDLWFRMLQRKAKCYNIQENLIHMRTSNDFYKRRSGRTLLSSLFKLRKQMLSTNFIGFIEFITCVWCDSIITLCPNFLRKVLYKNVIRK